MKHQISLKDFMNYHPRSLLASEVDRNGNSKYLYLFSHLTQQPQFQHEFKVTHNGGIKYSGLDIYEAISVYNSI